MTNENTSIRDERINKAEKLRELGINPYPNTYSIDNELNELTFNSKGRKLVFIDAAKFSDAYRIVGQYLMKGEKIMAEVKVFKDNELKASFKIKSEGLMNAAKEIIKKSIDVISE